MREVLSQSVGHAVDHIHQFTAVDGEFSVHASPAPAHFASQRDIEMVDIATAMGAIGQAQMLLARKLRGSHVFDEVLVVDEISGLKVRLYRDPVQVEELAEAS